MNKLSAFFRLCIYCLCACSRSRARSFIHSLTHPHLQSRCKCAWASCEFVTLFFPYKIVPISDCARYFASFLATATPHTLDSFDGERERPNKRELTYLPYSRTNKTQHRQHYGLLFLLDLHSLLFSKYAPAKELNKITKKKTQPRGATHTAAQIKLQNSEKRNKFIWLGFGCWLRSMHSFFFFS